MGGYVNFLNAQNINCRGLSEHLDKERFEVWTMLYWHQNAKDFENTKGVHYLMNHRPVRLLGWIPYLRGIIHCDAAYLPKGEWTKFCLFISRLFGCKVFTTLEGVLDEVFLSRQKNPQETINRYKLFEPDLYSITKYMAESERERHGLQCREKILYLGTETSRFLQPPHEKRALRNLVMIGNDLNRKRAVEFIKMSFEFPELVFNIIGGNDIGGLTFNEYVKRVGANNVVYRGMLDHTQLSALLQDMDLMFFPSRSEGFPKVMLETACAGVPTLCYGDYGADEWITSGVDGFVVNTFEEAKSVIQELIDHPERLNLLSRNAVELGKHFDWKVLIKEWEEEIIRLSES